jgi:8-hydroxy-5-deazaflavin:NADPH oxidoreductase
VVQQSHGVLNASPPSIGASGVRAAPNNRPAASAGDGTVEPMNLAVIGSGNIGGTLARKWAAAGHRVTLGVRDPQKAEVQRLVQELGPHARATSVQDAVADAEAVLFAVPGGSMAQAVPSLAASLDGKVVIDATNNLSGPVLHSVETITRAAPGAHVYRAFNIYGWENFADPTYDGVPADLFYAGPEGAPQQTAERLIADVGLRPMRLGGLDKVGVVDSLLPLWFTLSADRKLGRHFGFKVLGA